MLHLQLQDDGCYYVALFPRQRHAPAPRFSVLGNGYIVKVEGAFGTDYGFLADGETAAAAVADGVGFRGRAGAILDRGERLTLSLGANGEVRCRAFAVKAAFPVNMRVRGDAIAMELPAGGGEVRLTAPGEWGIAQAPEGASLGEISGGHRLAFPPGTTAVTLTRRK